MAQDGRIDPVKDEKPEDGGRVKDGVSGNTSGAVSPKKGTVRTQGVAAPKKGKDADVVKTKGG